MNGSAPDVFPIHPSEHYPHRMPGSGEAPHVGVLLAKELVGFDLWLTDILTNKRKGFLLAEFFFFFLWTGWVSAEAAGRLGARLPQPSLLAQGGTVVAMGRAAAGGAVYLLGCDDVT